MRAVVNPTALVVERHHVRVELLHKSRVVCGPLRSWADPASFGSVPPVRTEHNVMEVHNQLFKLSKTGDR